MLLHLGWSNKVQADTKFVAEHTFFLALFEERMRNKFFPAKSLYRVNNHNIFQKPSYLCRSSVVVEGESFSFQYFFGLDFLIHLVGVGGTIGHLPEDHLEEDDSD